MDEADEAQLARRAQEELDLAHAATDRATKAAHLNRAAEYATARERVLRATQAAASETKPG